MMQMHDNFTKSDRQNLNNSAEINTELNIVDYNNKYKEVLINNEKLEQQPVPMHKMWPPNSGNESQRTGSTVLNMP